MLLTLHRVGGGWGGGGHVDVPVTLHTGLDATLCYAVDVAVAGRSPSVIDCSINSFLKFILFLCIFRSQFSGSL